MAVNPLEQYYRFHSKIYDLTRWSFLFGRKTIVDLAQQGQPKPRKILEIGCGTGKNLQLLCTTFDQAEITAVDMSADMIQIAKRKVKPHLDRVTFVQQMYQSPIQPEGFDLILFSYSLTMMNPGWDQVIEQAAIDLAPNGVIAVTDFHDSPFDGFKKWMGVNHVRMDSHLTPILEAKFKTEVKEIKPAYFGWWNYLLYLGRK